MNEGQFLLNLRVKGPRKEWILSFLLVLGLQGQTWDHDCLWLRAACGSESKEPNGITDKETEREEEDEERQEDDEEEEEKDEEKEEDEDILSEGKNLPNGGGGGGGRGEG